MHRFVRVTAFGLLCSALALSACSTPPSNAQCGNGVVEGSEGCDDGNTTDGDGCEASCTATPGVVACGNGQVESGEACDDGNQVAGDGCENDCTLTGAGGGGGGGGVGGGSGGGGGTAAVCGNGTREGAEFCDDGNQVDTDACKNDCTFPPPADYCGDNQTTGSEACDDGNAIPGDGCENDCTTTVAATSSSACGDNVRQTPEDCDDGNFVSGDGCESDCTKSTPTEVTCPGAALPAPTNGCDVSVGDASKLIIGTVLLPGRVLKGGQVLVSSTGDITCVSCDCSGASGAATASKLFCGQNVVSPGLINSHDHLTFPGAPYVAPGQGANGLLADGGIPERYEHRHDWRLGQDGHTKVSNGGGGSNAQYKWNELRQLMAGTTSISGSGGAVGLLRNLDAPDTSATSDSQMGLGANTTGANYDTFPLGDTNGTELTASCSYSSPPNPATDIPAMAAYLPHVAEGIEASARNEFFCLSGIGSGSVDVLGPRTAMIHGVGLKPADVKFAVSKSTSLIWSPRSNVSLYGDTAQVTVYSRAHANIAVGTDWVRSGSMNLLRELQCIDYLNQGFYAKYFSDESIWKLATWNGAVAATVQGRTGILATGHAADIAIYRYTSGNPYRAVIASHPKDVVLTMRGGKVLYGETPIITALGLTCDSADVCGVAHNVCLSGEINETLSALQGLNSTTYPLFFCNQLPQNEPTCSPMRGAPWLFSGANPYTGVSSSNDSDGDGIDNTSDNCPNVFNPKRPQDNGNQGDADGDGTGDVCDVCPLNASTTVCAAYAGTDMDSDGIANAADKCPGDPDPSQTDTDGDGIGDKCDACPSFSNAGGIPCPPPPGVDATIYEVKGIAATFLNQRVKLTSVLVTATNSSGFFVQVHPNDTGYTNEDYSGLFVYYPAPTGSPSPRTDIKIGDRITIPSGVVRDYFGQVQLTSLSAGSVQVLSSGNALPSPIVVTVDTVNSRARALEGVLLQLNTLTVADINPAAGTGDTAPTNEFTVRDTGTTQLRVNDYLYLINPAPQANETFAFIRGVLDYRNNNYKVEPRGVTDVSRPPSLVEFGPADQFAREGQATPTATVPTGIKVRLNSVQATDTTVTVTSSDPTKLLPTAAVVIPAGQVEANVLVQGVAQAASVTLTASLSGGNTLTTTVRVLGASETPALVSVTPNPGSVVKGQSLSMAVKLDIPGATDQTVTLAVNPATGFGTVPATVTVPANQLTATFSFAADANASGSGTVTATLGASTQTATVSILTQPATTHVVISEIAVAGANANDEFVELYNPTNQTVDISGWKLQYKSAAGAAYSTYVTMPANSTISPNGYYLITSNVGSTGYVGTVTPDTSRSSGLSFSGTAGHVRIGNASVGTAKADSNAIDTVGYGSTADTPETAVAPTPPSGGTIERKALTTSTSTSMGAGGTDELSGNGIDTNNNSADFVTRAQRQPQNKASATEP